MPIKKPAASLLRDDCGSYLATRFLLSEEEILAAAEEIIERRFLREASIASVADTRRFLRAKLASQPHEVFAGLFLDQRHRVIAYEALFHGTIDGAAVYPRQVLRRALHHNAAALILVHNHPSGTPEPSRADERITQRLKEALAMFDVRVLDHIVVGGTETVSFAERGLL